MSESKRVSMREAFDKAQITEDEYYIEYGKAAERIRILDILMNSDLDQATLTEIRKLIKED